jgi:uncharacterized circularly permuted ATP-grasp superfamily protein
MAHTLEAIIQELDQRIVSDPGLTLDRLQDLVTMQRELGLLHGDRPTCPFLRPHIVSRSQYVSIANAAELISDAFDKLVANVLSDEKLAALLSVTETELELARIDPGYERVCVTSRLDAYVSESSFKFLEYNAETPAGVGDQMQLEKLLSTLEHNEDLLSRHSHWWPEPHRYLVSAVINAYMESGGQKYHPHVAIVDWKGVATESEFHVLKRCFDREGFPTVIADPRELTFEDGRLYAGEFPIDIVYKRVVIHEFLERFGKEHPLVRAYAAGAVCMTNSFRSKIAHKKAGFAILSDPKFEHLFDREEIEVIRRHIPWTRIVRVGPTTFEDEEIDLFDFMRTERERLVLKPNDDYGGHGVFIGWETNKEEWERAIALTSEKPYVVQERVAVQKQTLPMFSDGVSLEEMFIDFNPFLFHNRVEGALIRLSSSALLNVTSGGGQTALLVLEGH